MRLAIRKGKWPGGVNDPGRGDRVTTSSNAIAAVRSLEDLLSQPGCAPEGICTLLGQMFSVRTTEVGLLRLEGRLLKFLYPTELQAVGAIPISSSAIAARTASSQKAALFNNFVQVRHNNIFESMRLKGAEEGAAQTIQKLMSAPIISLPGEVLGVVQVSRKGATPGAAGPDFGPQELSRLQHASSMLAILMPRILANESGSSCKLQFRSCASASLAG